MAAAANPKGMVTDLTSISHVLATILKQVEDIGKQAGTSATAVGKVAKGAGGGTNKGTGSSALGLSTFSGVVDVPGMKGGLKLAGFTVHGAAESTSTAIKPQTPTGTGGGRIGTAPVTGMSRSEIGANVATAGVSSVAAIGKGVFSALPDVQAVMERAGAYYSAGVSQGGVSRSVMQSAAISSGLTSTGMSGNITKYLSDTGIAFSTQPGSEYMQKSTSISNAVKYLNMDPMAASQAIAGLNSGATSKNMMLNMGIYTSDPRSGKSYSQQQIFEQIHQRLKSGRRENVGQKGVDEINTSYYRGNLKESLIGSGLTADQADLYRQWEIAKAQGQNLDLSNSKDMKKLQDMQTAGGNENPNTPGYEMNASREQLFNKYEQPYLDGIKTATEYIKGLNEVLGGMATVLGPINATLATLAGDKGFGGILSGIQGVIGSLGTLATALAGGQLIKLLGKLLPGGTPGTPPTKPTASGPKGGAPTAADKAAKSKVSPSAASKAAREAASKTGPAAAASKTSPASAAAKGAKGVLKGALPLTIALGALDAAGSWSKGVDARIAGEDPWTEYGKTLDVNADANNWWNWLGAPFTALGTAASYLGGTQDLIQGRKNDKERWAQYSNRDYSQESTWLRDNGQANTSTWRRGGSGSSVGTGASTPANAKSQKQTFIMPCNGKITDKFGPRDTTGMPNASKYHHGIDIGVSVGTPVGATASGTVTVAGWSDAIGNNIEIQHGGGYTSIYMHLSRLSVKVGDTVQQGQQIAASGDTGYTCYGAHLHFGMKYNGSYIDPLSVMNGGASVPITGNSNDKQSDSKTSSSGTGYIPSQDSIIAGVSARQAATESVSSYGGASAGKSGTPTVAGMSSGGGANGRTNNNANVGSSKRNASMYLPGAPSAKTGDSYVAQDGPVNVHAGEAILTAEQASVWRDAIRQGYGGGKKNGGNVTINVTIAEASQAEAQKFAEMVKTYLDNDNRMSRMGSR